MICNDSSFTLDPKRKGSTGQIPVIVAFRLHRFKYRISMDQTPTQTEMELSKHRAYFRKYRAALRNAAGMELNGISPHASLRHYAA